MAKVLMEEIVGRGIGLDGWASTAMVLRTVIAVGAGEAHRELIARSSARRRRHRARLLRTRLGVRRRGGQDVTL